MELRRVLLLGAVLAALVAGCGDAGSGSGSGAAGASGSVCLSAAQVSEEVDRIAEGFESSDAEVEAKTNEIAVVRAREC